MSQTQPIQTITSGSLVVHPCSTHESLLRRFAGEECLQVHKLELIMPKILKAHCWPQDNV